MWTIENVFEFHELNKGGRAGWDNKCKDCISEPVTPRQSALVHLAGWNKIRKHKSTKLPVGKICKQCGNKKCVTDFYENRSLLDGRANKCKDCVSEYAKQKRKAEKEWLHAQKMRRIRQAIPEASTVPVPRFVMH